MNGGADSRRRADGDALRHETENDSRENVAASACREVCVARPIDCLREPVSSNLGERETRYDRIRALEEQRRGAPRRRL